MITLAVTTDETVDGQRRAAGKKIRHRTAICVDNYNIVYAVSSGTNPFSGKKFHRNLSKIVRCMVEDGIKEDGILKLLRVSLNKLGQDTCEMSIADMDEAFNIAEREDNSTGKLSLYGRLKNAGFSDEEKSTTQGLKTLGFAQKKNRTIG